jgi:hypothetical protein
MVVLHYYHYFLHIHFFLSSVVPRIYANVMERFVVFLSLSFLLKLTSLSCLTDFQNLLDWKVQELQELLTIILIEELVKMESSKLWIVGS